ncbi:MAG: 4-alpha-glucanotransferase [Ferruginibacter sp.]
MLLNFYIRFSTRFGEHLHVSGNANVLGNETQLNALRLQYLNNEFWHGQVELKEDDLKLPFIHYKYIFRTEDGEEIVEWDEDRIIDLAKNNATEITLVDTWNHAGDIANAFYTKPFQDVLLKRKTTIGKEVKNFTHEFKVKAPLLSADEVLCIIGEGNILGGWKTEKPLLLNNTLNWWTIKLDLKKEVSSVIYKYGVYNIKEKKFVRYESGNNRILPDNLVKETSTIIHDGFAQLPLQDWKGAGIAIPVFSLRTKKSLGTGEFTDIKLLVDWAKNIGIKLIQLLPVNDTTATHTRSDSYPYAAISAFALHPLYLNIEKVASNNSSVIKSLKKHQKELNELAEVDYEAVMNIKLKTIKELYKIQKDTFLNDPEYFEFFNLNREWLVPYAAFCYLRDKYKTPDCSKWKTYNSYSEKSIQQLVQPSQKHYDEIALHYFTQYHLHLQLKDATDYAHKNGIVVKGDLPIGIYRYSCDAWINPSLYNMNAQAGAPPDAFAVKGQNWGFPTYNWQKMQEDNFSWWRNRFEQMSVYFDAFRIDHILGFFRIWSIPLDAVEGILGRFVPAIPVHVNEFHHNDISFSADRFCKPFINDAILQEVFGADSAYVKQNFLEGSDNSYELKHIFNTQRKVEEYFANKPLSENENKIKLGLYNLISNIILFEEEGSNNQLFHFRINMEQTSSYHYLDAHSKYKLWELYVDYFYHRQDDLWEKKAMQKLPGLKRSTRMLVCGEDLGMVPHCVPEVIERLGILSLEIQRMPKQTNVAFTNLSEVPYLSVVTPSTHDMSTIRGWWIEDANKTQYFYNYILGHYGGAPSTCSTVISKEIIVQHLRSPAMWSIFQLQDILAMNEKLCRKNPDEERINVPANPLHVWKYRMHIYLEELLKEKEFNEELKNAVVTNGR